jgi:hypothetical protein
MELDDDVALPPPPAAPHTLGEIGAEVLEGGMAVGEGGEGVTLREGWGSGERGVWQTVEMQRGGSGPAAEYCMLTYADVC